MSVNSLPKTVTRQRRDCYLNPGPSAPESSTLTIRLPSHPRKMEDVKMTDQQGVFSNVIMRFHVLPFQLTTGICVQNTSSGQKRSVPFMCLDQSFRAHIVI